MSYKKKILNSFDIGAQKYDLFAEAQILAAQLLTRSLKKHIDTKKKSKFDALELGSGTGNFSKKVFENFDLNSFVMCDFAPKMIDKGKKKIANYTKKKKNIFFLEKDFDEISCFKKYDFIISNMSLHWSKDLFRVLRNIFYTARRGTILSFSLPNDNSFEEIKTFEKISNHKILLNKLPNHKILINYLSLRSTVIFSYEKKYKIKFSNIIDFLKKIKIIGAGAKLFDEKNKLYFLRNFKKKSLKVSYCISFFIVLIND